MSESCISALDNLRGVGTFLIMVGTAVGIWAMLDVALEGKILKLKAQYDERGVYYCPLHKTDRVDCEDKHGE